MKHLVLAVSLDSSLDLLSKFADVVILDWKDKLNDRAAYDTVYIRSHFSHPDMLPQVFTKEIETITRKAKLNNPHVKFVDDMDTVDMIVKFEDKWHQYQAFWEYMPETQQLSDISMSNPPHALVYKKKLSSRGVGITWSVEDTYQAPDDWIAQQSLSIDEELRIYVVNGEVCPVGSVRRSMTEDSQPLLTSARDLTDEEVNFALDVHRRNPNLDLIGLDVAVTPNGLKLLEVNRSPGFAKFFEFSGINLAEILYRA